MVLPYYIKLFIYKYKKSKDLSYFIVRDPAFNVRVPLFIVDGDTASAVVTVIKGSCEVPLFK